MGQLSSFNKVVGTSTAETIIPGSVSVLQDEILRQARTIQEIAILSYEDFQICLEQLNELCRIVTDINGKQLLFAVKKGTDSTLLWKGTVKIACVKLDPETKIIESYRLFNLNQFLKIFKTLECQLTAALQSSRKEKTELLNSSSYTTIENDVISTFNELSKSLKSDSVECNTSNCDQSENFLDCSNSSKNSEENDEKILEGRKPKNIKLKNVQVKNFTASMLLEEVDNLANSIGDQLGECSICFERKREVMLPCTHSYCMPCIEQWNAWHKTCPFCRETLDNTNDTWVISDIPRFQEISDDICSALINLTSSK